jgi:hypothetical protein
MLTQVKDAAWEARIAQLGQVVDLEASARSCGAMLRRRRVRSAAELLRLCLAYVLGRLSLHAPSAWAAAQGWAAMSGVAVLNRLRASADRLGALAAALLTEHYPEVATDPGEQRPPIPTRYLIAWEPWLIVVGATTVVPPGDKRGYWLVHTVSISLLNAFGWWKSPGAASRSVSLAVGCGRAKYASPTAVTPVPTIWPWWLRAGPTSTCTPPPTILGLSTRPDILSTGCLMSAGDAGEAG